jgi:hypothetical protein
MTNWIVGPKQQAISAVAAVAPQEGFRIGQGTYYGDVGGARLWPVPLLDGNYALPVQVLTNPAYSAALPHVGNWTVQNTISPVSLINAGSTGWKLYVANGDRLLRSNSGHFGSITMPASNVYKFTLRPGERVAATDITGSVFGQNRRSTLINAGTLASPAVDTIHEFGVGGDYWISFSYVIGEISSLHRGPMVFSTRGLSNPRREPAVTVTLYNDPARNLEIMTSSALQPTVNVTRYQGPRPADKTPVSMVFQITAGESGHLNAWINGTQVVNVDAAIGHWDVGTQRMGLQLGPYTDEAPEKDVVYYANVEYGTASLSSRIANPLSVPSLDW